MKKKYFLIKIATFVCQFVVDKNNNNVCIPYTYQNSKNS